MLLIRFRRDSTNRTYPFRRQFALGGVQLRTITQFISTMVFRIKKPNCPKRTYLEPTPVRGVTTFVTSFTGGIVRVCPSDARLAFSIASRFLVVVMNAELGASLNGVVLATPGHTVAIFVSYGPCISTISTVTVRRSSCIIVREVEIMVSVEDRVIAIHIFDGGCVDAEITFGTQCWDCSGLSYRGSNGCICCDRAC